MTEMVEQLLGLPKAQVLFDLANAIGRGDVKAALGQADAVLQSGLSVDSFIAALVDHLRNLLILRTCGADSALVEVPGVGMEELVAQANQFDPVALTQDITILEELRRNIRQSQAGRALLDATLVRMALADQFSSIGELLSRLDGGGSAPRAARAGAAAAPAQKKNSELAPTQSSPSFPPLRLGEGRGEGELRKTLNESAASAPASPNPNPLPRGEGTRITPPPPPPSLDDDDDDLPRPGKVWTGPSLAEMAREAAAKSAPAAPAPSNSNSSNVEPVDPSDLPAVWQSLLNLLAAQSSMVHPLLTPARLVGIEDGRAVIRYGPQHDTFVKMLERNGKKDLVREKLTEVLGQAIGVKFEVDASAEAAIAPAEAAAPRPAIRNRATPRSSSQPAPAEPSPAPAAPAIKLTPELIESLRNEPLIKSLMDNMGATIVKVE
jgi:DNA polymerase-3 subunit gamma/tau